MDLESVQAFCGERWMGEHRQTVKMLRVLSQFVPTDLYIPFAQTMVDGVLNCLYGDVPKEELEKNLSPLNLKSAEQKLEVVQKVLNKERLNHLTLAFSGSFARFTTSIGINKLGVVSPQPQPPKKDRPYRHCSRVTVGVKHPVNKLCNVKAIEPKIKYGTVLADQCQNIWRIAQSCPGEPIDVYDNNASGAFPQHIFNQSIAKTNISIAQGVMLASIALHFGRNFGPASWEPTADIRCFLVQRIYKHCTYQKEINKEALDRMDFPQRTKSAIKRDHCRPRPPKDKYHIKCLTIIRKNSTYSIESL